MIQNTLVLIKPDAVRRRMVGQIIAAVENLGLTILYLKQKTLPEKDAIALYKENEGKWHFKRNIKHITSGPSVIIHVQGKEAIKKCRDMVETFRDAHKDLIKLPENLIHASSNNNETSLEELLAVECFKIPA